MGTYSVEQHYADLLRGGTDNSPLTTDGYKFAMAQSGYPLREEGFYLGFRWGGPLFIPFDFAKVIQALRPRLPNSREQGFLAANGYGMTPAMEEALQGDMAIWSQPKLTWANDREPVLVPEGPSFLVSWMETLAIPFHFPMQIATAMIDGETEFKATCEDEASIIRLVWHSLAHDRLITPKKMPQSGLNADPVITVCEEEYRQSIRERLARLCDALGGDIHRAFEVGGRAMSCMQMHRIALEECKAAGINRTSNVKLAYDLYMIPVGTTGHEHQERHGGDTPAFRAIRDQRPEPPSYLPDTFNTMASGIPAAIDVMRETPQRRCSTRLDSGDQEAQVKVLLAAQCCGFHLNFFYIFMDGYDDGRVHRMEKFTSGLDIPPDDRHYGLGGFIVDPVGLTDHTRNVVAMIYKLCFTGGSNFGRRDVMKYSTPGKSSLPGRPCVRVVGGERLIAQQDEVFMEEDEWPARRRPWAPSKLSPMTAELVTYCRKRDLGHLGGLQ